MLLPHKKQRQPRVERSPCLFSLSHTHSHTHTHTHTHTAEHVCVCVLVLFTSRFPARSWPTLHLRSVLGTKSDPCRNLKMTPGELEAAAWVFLCLGVSGVLLDCSSLPEPSDRKPPSPLLFSQLPTPLAPSQFLSVPLAFEIFPWHQSPVDSKQLPSWGD